MTRLIYMVCAALAAGTTAGASTAETAQRIQRVEQGLLPQVLIKGETPPVKSLTARMAELKVPGASVAVIHEGRIEWTRGYGARFIGGPAVDEQTLFQAASISKPVFALAVLHQVDAGKLDLDTNVNDYLKSWKLPDNDFTREQKVTLRRVLSHTAGLTVHGFPGYGAADKLPTTVQILDGAPPANTNPIRVDILPGSRHRYSGGGYTLAQLVLTDVTGEPLDKLLRDTVLTPLGMSLSTFQQPLPGSRLAEFAMPYRGDGTAVPGGPHVHPEVAAAGLWTTPSDLARYALGVIDALKGKSKILSAKTARMMVTPHVGVHGLGPVSGGKTDRKYFTHGGSNAGYRCLLVAYEDGEGAVIMTSGDNGGELMEEVIRGIAHVYQWPDFAPPVRTVAAVEPEALEKLIGVYELEEKSLFVVRRNGRRLLGHIVGHAAAEMLPSAQNELFAREYDVTVKFETDASGAATSVRHQMYDRKRAGKRVDEARARRVLASIERSEQRVREQKPDPRADAAIRKLIVGVAGGNPDYESMNAQLADITRQQLKGLQGWFGSLGTLKTLEFQKVRDNGADVYLAKFDKGEVVIEAGLGEDGRFEMINLR